MTKARIRDIRKELGEASGPIAMMLVECIVEIEHIQAFTRQGKIPEAEPEPEPLPKKANGKAPDPRVKEFIEGWTVAFQEHHREKYLVQAKDFPAIKRLLAMGTVDELLDRAWEAWAHGDKFNCRQAATVCGFASRYNDIVLELKTLKNGNRPARTDPPGVNL